MKGIHPGVSRPVRKLKGRHFGPPRFKYHALPGGGKLYDIIADSRETSDVKDKFPEETERMAAACRKRWDDIMMSGRAFLPPPAGTKQAE